MNAYIGEEKVAEWLSSLQLSQYLSDFIKHGFNNILACSELDEKDLDAMSIDKRGDRKTLISASKILNKHLHETSASTTNASHTHPHKQTSYDQTHNPFLKDSGKSESLIDFWSRAKPRTSPFDCDVPFLIDPKQAPPHFRIFLVRHAESNANVDKNLYKQMSDHAISISENGQHQAHEAGEQIKKYFSKLYGTEEPPKGFYCRMWTSPYRRARETTNIIRGTAGAWVTDVRENIMLAEQQFGLFEGADWTSNELEETYAKEIDYYRKAVSFGGRFWAKVPLGESRMDVCLRAYQSFGSLHRDASMHGITNIIIVSHGSTIRAFMMMWLHLTPEWYEVEPNPKNCSIRLIADNMDQGYIWLGPESPRTDLLVSSDEQKDIDPV